jgi:preprotein translocase subunit SecF
MEFFKSSSNVNFLKIHYWTTGLSVVLVILSLISLWTKGINWGLDFTGGTVIELHYPAPVELDEVRNELSAQGFGGAVVQHFGTSQDIMIRLAPDAAVTEQMVSQEILQVLQAHEPQVELLQVEAVGAQVGSELAQQGIWALLLALALTAIYIAVRFQYRFALSAALALAHDPIVVLGIFSFFQIEFDLPTLAALLAVIGYSLNDTIVVFDRVRENFVEMHEGTPTEIMNLSINQTLSRTVMTSALTLLVVVALLLFGGHVLFGFSLALFIGIIIGTYSSIYVAGALAIALGLTRQDLLPPPKTEADDRP